MSPECPAMQLVLLLFEGLNEAEDWTGGPAHSRIRVVIGIGFLARPQPRLARAIREISDRIASC